MKGDWKSLGIAECQMMSANLFFCDFEFKTNNNDENMMKLTSVPID